ncbi:MAG: hypothetical protein HC906_08175 [Bacteroidales bacterium]|nr:hypothetical protein [Bacteroidales bacterium]
MCRQKKGLTASYFEGEEFEKYILKREDHVINFDWGTGTPITNVPYDYFSIRWEGEIQTLEEGEYTFTTLDR